MTANLVAVEFTDFTRVNLTNDGNTKVDATTGRATLTGSIRCTRADTFRLALEVHQDQTVNGEVVDIHSASDIPVSCTTNPKSWSATMALSNGETYQASAARASAATFQASAWAALASVTSAVKITIGRN